MTALQDEIAYRACKILQRKHPKNWLGIKMGGELLSARDQARRELA